MVLSKRERNIAIGTLATVVLGGLYYFALSPYFDARDKILKQQADLKEQQQDEERMFNRRRRLQPIWAEMQKGGLKTEEAEAASQAYHAVHDWAQAAGVELTALRPDRTTEEGNFQVISFHLTVTGHLASVSRLLYSIETARIPVRINDMQIRPQKEGTDDLSVQLSISTLCMQPEAAQGGTSVSSADLGGGQP